MSDETLASDEVLPFLDEAIDNWRALRDGPDADRIKAQLSIRDCICYVDAFQSVRASMFGEIKP